MTIRINSALAGLAAAATSQAEWCAIIIDAMGVVRRAVASRNDVVFRNCALTGAMIIGGGAITGLGNASGTTVALAADLSTGASILRIEGGEHWMEGTLGLPDSGCDFIISANPTATNGFALSSVSISAPDHLPSGIVVPPPDLVAPSIDISTSPTSVTEDGSVVITAAVSDNVAVDQVEFFRSGALIGIAYAPPWQLPDAINFGLNGTVTYTARAYDAAGNSTLSGPQNVTVAISPPLETGSAVAIGSAITSITFENTSASAQTNVPVKLGHAFKLGHLPAPGAAIELKKADNSIIAAQLDVKATHPDGSVRHAIISALVPFISASEVLPLSIVRKAPSAGATPPTAASFVAAGLDATVSIVAAGVTYTASLATLIGSVTLTPWVAGPIANEWLLHGPLKTAGGAEHPLIHARFEVLAFTGTTTARIFVTLENSWVIPDPTSVAGGSAWVNNSPADVTYDLTIAVPGETTYVKTGIPHYNRGGIIRECWWNGAPPLHIRHNTVYLIASKAVPNYDQSVIPSPTAMASQLAIYRTKNAPMQAGAAMPAMGATGGRPDIGINPGWAVNYLLSQDKGAKEMTIGTSLLSASFPVCHRNKATDKPISIVEYPRVWCLTAGGTGDTLNSATGKYERIPPRVGSATNPNIADDAHQPAFNYVAYLVTGDHVHLEMLRFWNEWNAIQQNPSYRGMAVGYVKQGQIRGTAWRLRTLADTAWISPDGDSIKARAAAALDANFAFLLAAHPNGSAQDVANPFGIIHNPAGGYDALSVYPSPLDASILKVALAAWQQDFYASAVGRAAELGFPKARSLLNWMAKFQVARLLSSDYCWLHSPVFQMVLRETQTSPLFATFGQVYQASIPASIRATACGSQEMADANALAYGEPFVPNQMQGHSTKDDGYPANQQPAVAYVATCDHPQGADAWMVFDSRANKNSYTTNPAFAIIPRAE